MANQQKWERQPNEPSDWYERFLIFKLLGPGRSLLGAYNQVQIREGRQKSKGASPSWRKQAKEWQWESRAEAWDKQQQNKTEQRWEKSNLEWQKRREEQRQVEWDLSQSLIEKAQEMMQMPLVIKRIENEGSTVIIMPARWTMRDIPAYLDTASRLAAIATERDKQSDTAELEALKTLVEAGWVPSRVLEVAGTKMDDLKESVRSAFEDIENGI